MHTKAETIRNDDGEIVSNSIIVADEDGDEVLVASWDDEKHIGYINATDATDGESVSVWLREDDIEALIMGLQGVLGLQRQRQARLFASPGSFARGGFIGVAESVDGQ